MPGLCPVLENVRVRRAIDEPNRRTERPGRHELQMETVAEPPGPHRVGVVNPDLRGFRMFRDDRRGAVRRVLRQALKKTLELIEAEPLHHVVHGRTSAQSRIISALRSSTLIVLRTLNWRPWTRSCDLIVACG